MRSFLVFLALLALPVAALAEERGAEERGNAFEARQALARDLANAWQLERAAEAWKQSLLAQDPAQSCACPLGADELAKIQGAWQSAVGTAFDAGTITEYIEASLAAQHSEDALKSVATFAKSRLGRKFTEAALTPPAAGSGQSQAEQLAAEMKRLDAAARSLDRNPRRKHLIEDLIVATDATETLVDAMAGIWRGMIAGALASGPENLPRLSNDDVDRLVEMQRTQIAQTMAPTLPVMYEGMYAAIPNAELARYVAWLKTPDAHHFTRTTNRALIEALDRMAEKIGEQFAKNMQATDI